MKKDSTLQIRINKNEKKLILEQLKKTKTSISNYIREIFKNLLVAKKQ